MLPLGLALLLTLASARATGESQCQASGGGSAASSSKHPGPALLQTHHASSKAEQVGARATGIRSGDTVLFRAARTGHRIAALENGTVHARWEKTSSWQHFVIDKMSGSDDVQSGDAVLLQAWTGNRITVGVDASGNLDRQAVCARWDRKGDWETLRIEKRYGLAGPIMAGDEIFLQAWTGARLDANWPDARDAVQARWDHQGMPQKFIIEAVAPARNAAAVSTSIVEGAFSGAGPWKQ